MFHICERSCSGDLVHFFQCSYVVSSFKGDCHENWLLDAVNTSTFVEAPAAVITFNVSRPLTDLVFLMEAHGNLLFDR